MKNKDSKFGISVQSKHTGETVTLGSIYDSFEEAELEAKKVVCDRCNNFNIIHIAKDSVWKNRKEGFVSDRLYGLRKQAVKIRDRNI